jgi:hypothetical protein
MWRLIKKIHKDILTGKHGDCYDYAKVVGLAGLFCLNAGVLWHLYDDNVFDAINYATAFAAILAAACGGVWLKSKGDDMPGKAD